MRPRAALLLATVILLSISCLYRAQGGGLIRERRQSVVGGGVLSSSATPIIRVLGAIWDKFRLKVAIVKPDWLGEEQVEAVKRAFEAWDAALESFGRQYGYEYLARFEFSVRVSTYDVGGFDVKVYFSKVMVRGGEEIGAAEVQYARGRILEAKITLYTRYQGRTLSPRDLMNVAMHEIGHILGLDHATSSMTLNGPELMYKYYGLSQLELRPSTLDAYALGVLYSWAETGRFKPPDINLVRLPGRIQYRMLLYYRLTVISEYAAYNGSGWYLDGATVVVTAQPVYYLSNNTRAVFVEWYGDYQGSEPFLTIRMVKDTTIFIRWKLQHYVQIGAYPLNATPPSGWYDEGTQLNVSPLATTLEYRNRTLIRFSGWAGDVNSSDPDISVVVNRPLQLRAIFSVYYWVELISQYSAPTKTSGWYERGQVLNVSVSAPVLDVGDGTRLVFAGWNSTMPFVVQRPTTIVALWRRQFRVIVACPETGLKMQEWLDEGSTATFDFQPKIMGKGEGTRLVLKGIIVGNISHRGFSIVIKSPLKVRCMYIEELKASLRTLDLVGGEVEAELTVAKDGMAIKIKHSTQTWLEEGKWNIVAASCQLKEAHRRRIFSPTLVVESHGAECQPVAGEIDVRSPGVYDVTMAVSWVKLVAIDFLGVPSPFVGVAIDGREFTSGYDGLVIEGQYTSGKHEVGVRYLFYQSGFVVDLSESPREMLAIRVPISAYTIAMLIGLALLGIPIARKRLCQRRE